MTIDLFDKDSIDNAIKALEDYKESLDDKRQEFIRRIGETCKEIVEMNVSAISPFYKGEDVVVTVEYEDDKAIVTMSGEHVVFIEFGSGVTHNVPIGGSKHPKGTELGLTIGSYNPDSPNAASPTGWWFKNKWGKAQHTYGTPTFAPLYEAELEIIRRVDEIAKEVFGGE